MSDNLVLRLAHQRVHEYADDFADVMSLHQNAMECRDCEDFLRKGIGAAKFLRIAENIFRDAHYRGMMNFDDNLRSAINSLYVAWFNPCDCAEQWIEALRQKNHIPGNLDEFRQTCIEMRESMERKDWQSRATNARTLAEAEEPW